MHQSVSQSTSCAPEELHTMTQTGSAAHLLNISHDEVHVLVEANERACTAAAAAA